MRRVDSWYTRSLHPQAPEGGPTGPYLPWKDFFSVEQVITSRVARALARPRRGEQLLQGPAERGPILRAAIGQSPYLRIRISNNTQNSLALNYSTISPSLRGCSGQ